MNFDLERDGLLALAALKKAESPDEIAESVIAATAYLMEARNWFWDVGRMPEIVARVLERINVMSAAYYEAQSEIQSAD